MNAVEKFEAAIAKLEKLRDGARKGPLNTYHLDWRLVVVGDGLDDDAPILFDVSRAGSSFDAELIVTLHRTIDAQLAILRDAHERYSKQPDKEPVAPSGLNAVALADAILGGGPNE